MNKYYKIKVLLKIIFYTIIFIFICNFAIGLMNKDSIFIESRYQGGIVPISRYEANQYNVAISLALILISIVIYWTLFIKEINTLENYKNELFKYILLVVFEIGSIILSLCIFFNKGQLFSSLDFNSIILDFMYVITIILPPILLLLNKCIKVIRKKMDKDENR